MGARSIRRKTNVKDTSALVTDLLPGPVARLMEERMDPTG